MGGGPSTSVQQAEIPDELKPLFELLSLGQITQAPQATGIIDAILGGGQGPQLSGTQQLLGDLLAQRVAQNPVLATLPGAAALAQGAPQQPDRSIDVNEAFRNLLADIAARDNEDLQALQVVQRPERTDLPSVAPPPRPAPSPTTPSAVTPERRRDLVMAVVAPRTPEEQRIFDEALGGVG